MSTTRSDILTHAENGVMTVTLNRVDKKNSITAAMYAAMADALAQAEADPAIRAVVLQGHETVFSAGNDIGDFLNQPPATAESPVYRFLHGIAGFSNCICFNLPPIFLECYTFWPFIRDYLSPLRLTRTKRNLMRFRK